MLSTKSELKILSLIYCVTAESSFTWFSYQYNSYGYSLAIITIHIVIVYYCFLPIFQMVTSYITVLLKLLFRPIFQMATSYITLLLKLLWTSWFELEIKLVLQQAKQILAEKQLLTATKNCENRCYHRGSSVYFLSSFFLGGFFFPYVCVWGVGGVLAGAIQ